MINIPDPESHFTVILTSLMCKKKKRTTIPFCKSESSNLYYNRKFICLLKLVQLFKGNGRQTTKRIGI